MMELMIKLAAAALCGALFAAFLRPLSPAFGMLLSVVTGVLLLTRILDPVGHIFHTLAAFLTAAGISGDMYLPIIKAVGIAVLVHMVSQVCRDAGEGALGSKIELAGTIGAIAACIPLMQKVFELLTSMLL